MTDIGAMLFRLNVVLSLSILGGIGILAPLLHLEQFRSPLATLVGLGVSLPVLFFSSILPLINWGTWYNYRKRLGKKGFEPAPALTEDATEFSYFIIGAMQCGSVAILLIVTWSWFWTDDFMKYQFLGEHRPYSETYLRQPDLVTSAGGVHVIGLFFGILVVLWQLLSIGALAFINRFARHPNTLAERTVGTKARATILYIKVVVGSMLAMLVTMPLGIIAVMGLLSI